MPRVRNILKDGSVVEDLTGHVITKEQLPEVYEVIEHIEQREEEQ